MTRNLFPIGVMSFALSASLAFGVLAQPLGTADGAAKQWLSFVDGADYAKSWDRAGSPFKSRITAQDWQSQVAPAREALGAVSERKVLDVKLSNTMPGLPDGKFAVVQFNSRFAHKADAVETIALDTEGDHWAVIGYFVK